MASWANIKRHLGRFLGDDEGSVTVEFVVIFPIFFGFFLMTYESGMISLRHVMFEHGVDETVRDIRIGIIETPTVASIKARICEEASILPNCDAQMRLELIQQDPRAWTPMNATVGCVDRGTPSATPSVVTSSGSNMLMFLRACIRLDPVLPMPDIAIGFAGLGRLISVANDNDAAGGSYALVVLSAFVVEPRATSSAATNTQPVGG